jgi:hypothetical protein
MSSTLTPAGWIVNDDVVDERNPLPRLTQAQINELNARIAAGSNEYPTGTRVVRVNDEAVLQKEGVGTAGAFVPATATALSTELNQAIADTLSGWAYAQTFQLVSATRNADDAVTSASIVWPDGTTGTYTATTLSTDFPGATDAWSATYDSTPVKTITQPAVTRNANGAVTVQPAITIV